MKKTILTCFFIFSILFLFSCEKNVPQKKPSPDEMPSSTETVGTEEPVTKDVISDTKVEDPGPLIDPSLPSTTTQHQHQWLVFSLKEATCLQEGERVWSCNCRRTKSEKIEKTPHEFSGATCSIPGTCKRCGAKGETLKHIYSGNTCVLCKEEIKSPVFVLGKEIAFDETAESIIQKLGTPSEILLEGELKSLLYYQDYSRFTILQTDSVGLWGVFTFDPDAFFQVGGQMNSFSSFNGKKDTESESDFLTVDSCRIYGFRDRLGKGDLYALWMRYEECRYDFMQDSDILKNYDPQSRISFHYVNALRCKNGLKPLLWSQEAAFASSLYSEKMAKENFFYHDGLYGTRLNQLGVVWRSCGENISQGYVNSFFVCDAYYNCLDHRNNILNASFTHVGMGYFLKTDAYGPLAVMGTQTFYS